MDVEQVGTKMKKFGKVKMKKARINPSALPISKALGSKRRNGSGIRKPSAIMKKTLKKLAKRREMEL